jgi:hypothetical protein
MAFDLSDYQSVQERIEIFRKIWPEGRIINELVFHSEKEVIVKCSVWKFEDARGADAVDYAQETITEKGINSTSALEVCCTSATGRALSLLAGELSPSKKRASRTEMEKAGRLRDWVKDLDATTTRKQALDLYTEAKSLGVSGDVLEIIAAKGKQLAELENAPTERN